MKLHKDFLVQSSLRGKCHCFFPINYSNADGKGIQMGHPNHMLNEITKKSLCLSVLGTKMDRKRGLEETSGRVRDPSRETSQKQEE